MVDDLRAWRRTSCGRIPRLDHEPSRRRSGTPEAGRMRRPDPGEAATVARATVAPHVPWPTHSAGASSGPGTSPGSSAAAWRHARGSVVAGGRLAAATPAAFAAAHGIPAHGSLRIGPGRPGRGRRLRVAAERDAQTGGRWQRWRPASTSCARSRSAWTRPRPRRCSRPPRGTGGCWSRRSCTGPTRSRAAVRQAVSGRRGRAAAAGSAPASATARPRWPGTSASTARLGGGVPDGRRLLLHPAVPASFARAEPTATSGRGHVPFEPAWTTAWSPRWRSPAACWRAFTCGMNAQADNTAYLCGTDGFIEVPVPWKPPSAGRPCT